MQSNNSANSVVLTGQPSRVDFASGTVGPHIVTITARDNSGQIVTDLPLVYNILDIGRAPPPTGVFKTPDTGSGKSSSTNGTFDIKIELTAAPVKNVSYMLEVTDGAANLLRIPISLHL
ncbi:hypothetical protein J7443_22015 [Tropicibacter sp. R15_0]|uniref:hypothetical protein n=1 Tax=Tropicibacter sp. R15_0 TaxID=2821101 RepID=UPI001ADC88D7|nr:hypothetical protein [Tropicibacter sp. R15_0]MBO9467923.1 hypothetical protein [Tropicibacter sp. R15_0]